MAGEPGKCRVPRATGPAGSGRSGLPQTDSSFRAVTKHADRGKTTGLSDSEVTVTLHRAFADAHPPCRLPQAQPRPGNIHPLMKPLVHSFLDAP